eukprot:860548_1
MLGSGRLATMSAYPSFHRICKMEYHGINITGGYSCDSLYSDPSPYGTSATHQIYSNFHQCVASVYGECKDACYSTFGSNADVSGPRPVWKNVASILLVSVGLGSLRCV